MGCWRKELEIRERKYKRMRNWSQLSTSKRLRNSSWGKDVFVKEWETKTKKEMTPASLMIEEIMGKGSLANPSSKRTESRLNSFERSSSISPPQVYIICFLLFIPNYLMALNLPAWLWIHSPLTGRILKAGTCRALVLLLTGIHVQVSAALLAFH